MYPWRRWTAEIADFSGRLTDKEVSCSISTATPANLGQSLYWRNEMIRFDRWFLLCMTIAISGSVSHATGNIGRFTVDLETGLLFSGYNDVRIPGDTGTKFSLTEDVEPDQPAFWRARLSYRIAPRHTVTALVAPLTIEAHGILEKEIIFDDGVFPSGATVDATYRFDSYRLSYRYQVANKERLRIGMGLTAKIRDAAISLKSSDIESEKPNTGFVPLIHIRVQWSLAERFGILLDGDALAAPQGRAEDLLLAVRFSATDRLAFRGGYRLLEGGADNDEVYTFALFHYLSFGAEFSF